MQRLLSFFFLLKSPIRLPIHRNQRQVDVVSFFFFFYLLQPNCFPSFIDVLNVAEKQKSSLPAGLKYEGEVFVSSYSQTAFHPPSIGLNDELSCWIYFVLFCFAVLCSFFLCLFVCFLPQASPTLITAKLLSILHRLDWTMNCLVEFILLCFVLLFSLFFLCLVLFFLNHYLKIHLNQRQVDVVSFFFCFRITTQMLSILHQLYWTMNCLVEFILF